jgi:hypothetical protein
MREFYDEGGSYTCTIRDIDGKDPAFGTAMISTVTPIENAVIINYNRPGAQAANCTLTRPTQPPSRRNSRALLTCPRSAIWTLTRRSTSNSRSMATTPNAWTSSPSGPPPSATVYPCGLRTWCRISAWGTSATSTSTTGPTRPAITPCWPRVRPAEQLPRCTRHIRQDLRPGNGGQRPLDEHPGAAPRRQQARELLAVPAGL